MIIFYQNSQSNDNTNQGPTNWNAINVAVKAIQVKIVAKSVGEGHPDIFFLIRKLCRQFDYLMPTPEALNIYSE